MVYYLNSWRFSHYSVPIHWLVHGHTTSNNETIALQMPWACNIAKTMTSNEKQFTVTREMLTTVARDQRWPDVVAGISAHFSKICFCFVSLYNFTLNDCSRGEQWILFRENLNGKIEISRETKFTIPKGPVIKVAEHSFQEPMPNSP